MRISNCELDPIIAQSVLDWLNNSQGFLVLIGSPGTGKTRLCAAILAWMFAKVSSLRVWKEHTLFNRLFSAMDNDHSANAALKDLITDYFIIYDDFGSQNISEWKKGIIFDFIDTRHSTLKPTIITSNLTSDEIKEKYGERVWDRIFDQRNLIINTHGQKSYRQRRIN